MSGFVTSRLIVEQMTLAEGEKRGIKRWWELWFVREPMIYDTDNGIVQVPVNFITDGASVPRVFWTVFPSWGSYAKAAVVHDYLCYRISDKRPLPFCKTLAEAATVFKQAMQDSKTFGDTNKVLYSAVMLARNWPGKNVVSVVNPTGV